MRKPFICGNWKMNKTIGEAIDFAKSLNLTTTEVEYGVAGSFFGT